MVTGQATGLPGLAGKSHSQTPAHCYSTGGWRVEEGGGQGGLCVGVMGLCWRAAGPGGNQDTFRALAGNLTTLH